MEITIQWTINKGTENPQINTCVAGIHLANTQRITLRHHTVICVTLFSFIELSSALNTLKDLENNVNKHTSRFVTFSFSPAQTATDSSSNSSQKREPVHMLAPTNFCDARRHHCILGHLYEHHRPPDHYFLDQVSGRCICMLNVRSQQGSGCEKMKKKPKILEMNGSDPKET